MLWYNKDTKGGKTTKEYRVVFIDGRNNMVRELTIKAFDEEHVKEITRRFSYPKEFLLIEEKIKKFKKRIDKTRFQCYT